jgi:hypothetical protein
MQDLDKLNFKNETSLVERLNSFVSHILWGIHFSVHKYSIFIVSKDYTFQDAVWQPLSSTPVT